MAPPAMLISSDGKLDPKVLRYEQSDPEDSFSVVVTLSAYGLQQEGFLDDVLGSSFKSRADISATHLALVKGFDGAVTVEQPRDLLVLNVQPFDSPRLDQEDTRELSWNLALALSNVVIHVINMRDLARPNSNGVAALRPSFTQMLMLQSEGVVPVQNKRAFIFAIQDFDGEVVARNEIVAGVLQEMQSAYATIAKPPRSPLRITDLFEFEFLLLPNKNVQAIEYEQEISRFQAKLLDSASDDYLFAYDMYAFESPASLSDCAEAAWKKMQEEQTQDMPPKKDLMSAFDCDNAMRKVFEKYKRGVRSWEREIEGGVIVEKFGESAASMVKGTVAVYDQDAAPHKGCKAFKRKRDELKDLLDADLYNLFVMQLGKLREATFRMFKDKLDAIPDAEPRLEREVNGTLKEAQKSFESNAKALKPSFSSWQFENDAKELSSQMREQATDKLQRARIVDYQTNGGRRARRRSAAISQAGPRRRQPIQVGIHYLDPAPFGWKDSRYEKLNSEDAMEYRTDVPLLADGAAARQGGLSVPLMPGRDSEWNRTGQDFIYTERK